MRTRIFVAGIFLAAMLAAAQTVIPGPRITLASNTPVVLTATAINDLNSALQRGLFEEEGNRDLAAAISAYQSLAAQFDKSRQVAATAIFRLGECYRKLGRTNEAVAQYDRIVREFSDQQTLATLSRQNIAGLGTRQTARSAVDSQRLEQLQNSLLQSEQSLDRVRQELARTSQQIRTNTELNSLMETLNSLEKQERELRKYLRENHPAVKRIQDQIASTKAQLAAQGGDDVMRLKALQTELEAKINDLMTELAAANAQPVTASLNALATGRSATLDGLQSQYALLKAQLEQARKETNFDIVAKLFNDEELRQAVANVSAQKSILQSWKANPTPLSVGVGERNVRDAEENVELFRKRLFDYQEMRLNILQSAIQQTRAGQSRRSERAEQGWPDSLGYGEDQPISSADEWDVRSRGHRVAPRSRRSLGFGIAATGSHHDQPTVGELFQNDSFQRHERVEPVQSF
jgi:tetratricopeptide (TPR) repeat protein